MQELCKRLKDASMVDEKTGHFFIEAAAKWATNVIRYNTGDALDYGLDIAKAMVRYAEATGFVKSE